MLKNPAILGIAAVGSIFATSQAWAQACPDLLGDYGPCTQRSTGLTTNDAVSIQQTLTPEGFDQYTGIGGENPLSIVIADGVRRVDPIEERSTFAATCTGSSLHIDQEFTLQGATDPFKATVDYKLDSAGSLVMGVVNFPQPGAPGIEDEVVCTRK